MKARFSSLGSNLKSPAAESVRPCAMPAIPDPFRLNVDAPRADTRERSLPAKTGPRSAYFALPPGAEIVPARAGAITSGSVRWSGRA